MTARRTSIFVLLVVAALASTRAFAAQGTARSQDIDTSIRAAGMGGASAAVWWGEPGVWGNPASLAGVHGIGWVEGRTRLAPELPADIRFKSRRLLLGGAGVGVSLMGAPIDGLGRLRLDYGTSELTDLFGNSLGTFDQFEQVDAWGIGVSPLRVFRELQHAHSGSEDLAEWPVDFAVGFQHKHTEVAIAPRSLGGQAEADCIDWGTTARISLLPGDPRTAPAHLDLSAAYAVLNASDATFDFSGFSSAVPPSRIRRTGLGLHASLPSPWSAIGGAPFWLLSAQAHAIELGLAYDHERFSAGSFDPSHTVDRFGLELSAFDVLTARIGHVSDRTSDISDDTYGFGLRLPIGPWGSVAYDRAKVPQGGGLEQRVTRQGWSVWVDPWRIWMGAR